MKQKTLLLPLLTLTLALTSCSYYDIFLNKSESETSSETSSSSSSSMSEEVIPPGSNYYRSLYATHTYHDLGQKSLYGLHFPQTVGELDILVVPVIIKGYTSVVTEEARTNIEKAFFGTSEETGWESVKSYYEKSSFGRLSIGGTVTPWFDSGLSPLQLYNLGYDNYGDLGTFELNKMVYEWVRGDLKLDLTKYDKNKDGYIDAIWMIYSAPILAELPGVSDNDNPFWAFTAWNYLYSGEGSVTNPVPNTIAWASYNFLKDGKQHGIEIDSHTYIHETGHVLGLEDYYDYDGMHSPMGLLDMMDYNVGDHNSYSKLALGWVRPYVVTGDCTITIDPAALNGDCILIRNPKKAWEGSAFDEYLLLELVTNDSLWEQDMTKGYNGINKTFTEPGVRMLKVDSRLLTATNKIARNTDANTMYRLAFSNTPSMSLYPGSSNYRYDLISYISQDNSTKHLTSKYSSDNDSLFQTGDVFNVESYSSFFNNNKFNDGTTIPYEITFDLVDSNSATITFDYLGD